MEKKTNVSIKSNYFIIALTLIPPPQYPFLWANIQETEGVKCINPDITAKWNEAII